MVPNSQEFVAKEQILAPKIFKDEKKLMTGFIANAPSLMSALLNILIHHKIFNIL